MHSGEETSLWVLINGLVPFTNYTVQVNASNSQGSLRSDPVMISMPPGGKSVSNVGIWMYANALQLSPLNAYLLLELIFSELRVSVVFLVILVLTLFYWDPYISIILLRSFSSSTVCMHTHMCLYVCVCTHTCVSCFMHSDREILFCLRLQLDSKIIF